MLGFIMAWADRQLRTTCKKIQNTANTKDPEIQWFNHPYTQTPERSVILPLHLPPEILSMLDLH